MQLVGVGQLRNAFEVTLKQFRIHQAHGAEAALHAISWRIRRFHLGQRSTVIATLRATPATITATTLPAVPSALLIKQIGELEAQVHPVALLNTLILDGAHQIFNGLLKSRLALWRIDPRMLTLTLPNNLGKRQRLLQLAIHGRGTTSVDHIIRVLPVWQKRKLEGLATGQHRQNTVDSSMRSRDTGYVTVKTDHRFIGKLPEPHNLVFGERSTKARNRAFHTRLPKSNGIHIPFHHNRLPGFISRLAGAVSIEQHRPFMEERRFR